MNENNQPQSQQTKRQIIEAYGLTTKVWHFNDKTRKYGCAECCNGDHGDDDCDHKYYRKNCPHCKGTGWIPESDVISGPLPIPQPSHSPTEQPGDAKHTPGPWRADETEYSEYVFGPDGEMICQMRGWGYLTGERRKLSDKQAMEIQAANCKLIARAPALLSEVSTLRSKQAELVAENERMKQRGDNHLAAFNRKVDECDALQSENARLREALEVIIKLDCLSHGLHDAEEIAKAALTTTPKP